MLDAEASMGESWKKVMQYVMEDKRITLSGSMMESAMMARCFQKNEDWREVEVDIMFNTFMIPQEIRHLLEPVEDKPGFVRLPLCQELCPADMYFHPAFEEVLQGRSEKVTCPLNEVPHYLSPYVMKELFKNSFATYVDPVMSVVASIFRSTTNCSFSKTETTVEIRLCETDQYGSLSADFVPTARLLFWPYQATSWITRRRLWPPQDTIQSIVDKGCHLVPRTSTGGDVHSEWRLSFSGPEVILAQLRSMGQQQVYYFFKMFFYRYLKCVESSEPKGKPLYSYIIKTTMLWAQEELPPEDPIWASLEKSVQMLLLKLLGSLEAEFLSHYFIPEINLLENVGQDVRNQSIAFIIRWQNNILMTVPFDMPEKREYINSQRTMISEASAAVGDWGPEFINL